MTTADPKFQARPSADSWCVHVLWPSGETEIVSGFANQYQALKWINDDSANWVVERILQKPN